MRGIVGIGGIVAVLAAGYFVYNAQLAGGSTGGASQEQIDVTSIRAALLEIGQAQRLYVNAHGAYGTLDQLRAEGSPYLAPDRRGYAFSVEPNGAASFTATARPTAPSKHDWPTFVIDETMKVVEK